MIELFSPWREAREARERRHVGRAAERDMLAAGLSAFLGGDRPPAIYFRGPRGIGKSHLLAHACAAAGAADVAVHYMPAECVAMRSAQRLYEAMRHGIEEQPWRGWTEPLPRGGVTAKIVVCIDAFDRQLHALGPAGRLELSRCWQSGPPMWIVAAGTTLPSSVRAPNHEAPFPAHVCQLPPLTTAESHELLHALLGEADAESQTRRAAITRIAAGHPRALLALAERATRASSVSDALRGAVQDHAPLYQHLLHSLPPDAQRIVVHLANAPRELGPSEMARRLGGSTTKVSVQARRLVDDGVLQARSRGRKTWYRIADPLFRCWLEQRFVPWERTRVALALAGAPPPWLEAQRRETHDGRLHPELAAPAEGTVQP